MLYSLLKSLLFSLHPEDAHDLTLLIAKLSPIIGELSGTQADPRLKLKVGNTSWASPIGLAAGLDKNAEALDFFSHQGFGALECGTITLKPQMGNPKPRLWRYPEEKSLRNAMGFPNHGLLNILPRLKNFHHGIPLGANIGKNKDSTPDESIEELVVLFETLADEVDYLVINVSSPNTPGLRALQEKTYLNELFSALNQNRKGKDLYLKMAPDLEEAKVKELAYLVHECKLTGIIATNTTIMQDRGPGGVSGELLKQKSRMIQKLILSENLPIELIGVGGFSTDQDLFDFWSMGGKAVQMYTGYIYGGPDALAKIQKSIIKLLDEHQLKNLESFFALELKDRQKILAPYQPG